MGYKILMNEDKLTFELINTDNLKRIYKEIVKELQKRELNKLKLEDVETWVDEKVEDSNESLEAASNSTDESEDLNENETEKEVK